MEDNPELIKLEHLMSCREALHNKVEERRNLEKKLEAQNSRHEFILPKGSKEREAVVEQYNGVERFENSVRQMLKEKYRINTSHRLSEEIREIKERYPTHWKAIEEIRSQGGNAGESGSGESRPQVREKTPCYDEAFSKPSGQPPGPKLEPEKKTETEYDRVFQITTPSDKPSSREKDKEQQKSRKGMTR